MKIIQSGSKQFMFMMTTLLVLLLTIMATGCSGGDSGSSSTTSSTTSSSTIPSSIDSTVEAPGVPTDFIIKVSKVGGVLSGTLEWKAPTTGGAVDTYELYKYSSEIPTPLHLVSLPATNYEFRDDDIDMCVSTYYWVLVAKNAGGETSTSPLKHDTTGCGDGDIDAYGNNFAAAMIFADGIGITNKAITGEWTENNLSLIDISTGLRPSELEIPALSEFPYFNENTTYELDGVTYYKQKTVSTWQGEWINGSDSPVEHNVTAKWGDNLISQTLNTESIVRVEMVLTKALDTNMTAYKMVSLYGEKDVEIYGTDGTEYNTTTAFVFTAYARLTIEKILDNEGNPVNELVVDQALFESDEGGMGIFAAEINVAGNLTYGYVWDLPSNNIEAGTYRISFTLEDPSNIIIGNITEPDEGDGSTGGVLDSDKVVYIDITIHD